MTDKEKENKCRLICALGGTNPDRKAADIWQKVPPPGQANGGPVRQWMTWITTVKSRVRDFTDKEAEKRKEITDYLQKIVDETNPPKGPRYSFGEEK